MVVGVVKVLILILIGLVPPGAAGRASGAEPRAPLIEPSELVRRSELIGRRMVVDDRVAYFQWHKETGVDELYLKRTPVVFRLPPRLRFERAPQAFSARVEGVLRRSGESLWFDVETLELLASDLARLEQGLSGLSPRDVEGRDAWARWAEYRGREFQDQGLIERGRALEGEALRIEAERPVADPPRHWLALARRARQREVSEPEPSALAHRALAARLEAAGTVNELETMIAKVASFWPASPTAIEPSIDLSHWLAPYAHDPAATYRLAPEPVRAALTHKLWADATERLAERRLDDTKSTGPAARTGGGAARRRTRWPIVLPLPGALSHMVWRSPPAISRHSGRLKSWNWHRFTGNV